MKLLTVIPFCKGDAARAEQLIDLCFNLNNRKPVGHCLLVCAPDVHSEMKAKLKISASLAFETVEQFDVPAIITMTKHEQAMEMLKATAEHIAANYVWPWLWLEPDCVPVHPGWLQKLHDAYHNQPRRYLGLKMTSLGKTFLMRASIYPSDAIRELNTVYQDGFTYYEDLASKSINCRLFQWLAVNDKEDCAKVRPDALVVHHDKRGLLLDWVSGPKLNPEHETAEYDIEFGKPAENPFPAKRRGRPPKVSVPEPLATL